MAKLITSIAVMVFLFVVSTLNQKRLEKLELGRLRKIGMFSGHFSPLIPLGGVTLAILLTPSFSILGSNLSDLTLEPAPVSWLFSYSLIATGLAALPLAVVIMAEGNILEKASVVFLGISMNGLNMMGLFPKGNQGQVVGKASFFVCMTLGLYFYGAGMYRGNDTKSAKVSWGLAGLSGAIILTAWANWVAYYRFDIKLLPWEILGLGSSKAEPGESAETEYTERPEATEATD
ncbi:MAG: DUF998 domain-containing protein [Halobacteria archaeon]|nr:DUF998 domain-containing protein [Halobacteria archaeon]